MRMNCILSYLRIIVSIRSIVFSLGNFHHPTFPPIVFLQALAGPKNIDRGRNSSCYIVLCAKSVGNFTTVTDRQTVWFW